MARRPTIADLARETGLGVATVDRALNGRANVSARATALVAEAAERLGYHGTGLARFRAEAARRPAMKLGFLLQKPGQEFYGTFAAILERTVAERRDIRGKAIVRFPEEQGAEHYVRAIGELASTCDAIAVVAPNHPRITDLIQDIAATGLPVFTLLNDNGQGHRRAYFGTDNVKVGRIAAWMLSTHLHGPGELAIFLASGRWYGHVLRETGFQSYLRTRATHLTLLDSLINLDTPQVTYETTLDLLERRPNLRGIYVAGGGMEGAIAALRERRPPGKVALVVNELTSQSRAALMDRYALMVIGSPLGAICRGCVDAMVAAREGGGLSGECFLAPDLHVPESI